MSEQLTLIEPPPPSTLPPRQDEVMGALAKITGPATTADIQRVLQEHGLMRDRGCIAKRIAELRDKGLVEPVGHDYSRRGGTPPTTWRRT